LSGVYFSGTNFAKPVFSRIDGAVNFSWGNSSPDPALLPGSFSVRWTGRVRAEQSGPCTFYTLSDAGARLWVNRQMVISNWTVHPPTENSGTLSLVAGQFYDLTMEYFAQSGQATAVLLWSPPGESRQIIPQANLTPTQDNHPPVLGVLPDLIASPGLALVFPVPATDPDTPAQALTFALDPGAPGGASINPADGRLTWTPPPSQAPGNYPVTVRVTDNGSPLMTDARTVNITVVAPFTLAISRSDKNVALGWPVEATLFHLYTTTNLAPSAVWMRASDTPVISNGQFVLPLVGATNSARFFRLQAD